MSNHEKLLRSWHYVREAAGVVLNRHGDRADILRRFLFDLVGPFTPSIAVDRDGILYHLSTADKLISRYTFGTGSYEKELMARSIALLEREIGRSPLLRGRTLIDVGANIGTTSIPAIKFFGAEKVIAFEPSPTNFRLLQCNAIENGVTASIEAHDVAVSDRPGKARLELSPTNSGDHRLRMPGFEHSTSELDEGSWPTIDVSVVSLDEHLRDSATAVDDIALLWLDTQGHEGHVLAGAKTITSSAVPVACEYWPYGLQRAGGISLMHDIIAKHYRWVIDVRSSTADHPVRLPADSLPELQTRYCGHASYTDLLLLK